MTKSRGSSEDAENETGVVVKSCSPARPRLVTRSKLPAPASHRNIGILGILRHALGKDLSRITVPIVFNEPVSFLQRLAEYMEYSHLIVSAAGVDCPIKRLELITAFAVSTFSTNSLRMSKPFNPLLYETYELSRPDLGFEFVSEQVSHHPPISSLHAHGTDFDFLGQMEPKIKFWGRSIEVDPRGFFTLTLKNRGETYSWKAMGGTVHNLIMGKMYMALNGTLTVKCHESGLESKVRFRGTGKTTIDSILTGVLAKSSSSSTAIRNFFGCYCTFFATCKPSTWSKHGKAWEKAMQPRSGGGSADPPPMDSIVTFPDADLLLRIHEAPPNPYDNYDMPYFALALNEPPRPDENLPPTDSRLRPDMRLMENGDIGGSRDNNGQQKSKTVDFLDAAAAEKERLENQQRATASSSSKQGKEAHPQPRWFARDDKSGRYIFTGTYWNRDFSASPVIF